MTPVAAGGLVWIASFIVTSIVLYLPVLWRGFGTTVRACRRPGRGARRWNPQKVTSPQRPASTTTRTPLAQVIETPSTAEITVSNRRLLLGSVASMATRLAASLLGVVTAGLLARALGASDFGTLSFAVTLGAVALVLADSGLGAVATREMAGEPADSPAVLGALVLLRVLLALLLVGPCLLLVLLLVDEGGGARLTSALVLASLPVSALAGLRQIALARFHQTLFTLLFSFQTFAWAAVVALLYVREAPFWAFGVGYLLSATLQALLTWAVVRRSTTVALQGFRAISRRLLRGALPLALSGLFVTAYYRLDGIIVYGFLGPDSAGYYSAAYRFLDTLQILPATIAGILIPILSVQALGSSAASRNARTVQLALTTVLCLAAPVVVALMTEADSLVRLVYGEEFGPAAPLLTVLILAFVPICIGFLCQSGLTATSQLRGIWLVTAPVAIISVALNLALVPRYGVTVAAWLTVAAEVVANGGLAFLVWRRLGWTLPLRRLAVCATAAAGMALVILGLREHLGSLAAVGAGAAVYAGLVLGGRALQLSEIRSLLSGRTAPA